MHRLFSKYKLLNERFNELLEFLKIYFVLIKCLQKIYVFTESSQVSVGGGITWTHKQTLLLINIYRQEYVRMNNGKMPLRKFWQLVAESMKKKGYDIPVNKCSSKMDALKRQYKKVIDHNNQSGNNLITYKYFDVHCILFTFYVFKTCFSY